MKNLLRHPATLRVLAILLAAYGKFVFATSRVHVLGVIPPAVKQGPVMFAMWHQHICMMPLLRTATPYPLLALMSGSRDGTFMRAVGKHFNIGAVVGSSHRGGMAAARNLVRSVGSGSSLFITPDGPRGPAHVAKPGATEVARLTRTPIIPCAGWPSRGHTFGSWDGLRFPYPFGTITLVYGQPLDNPDTPSLTEALNTLSAQAQGTPLRLATPSTKS